MQTWVEFRIHDCEPCRICPWLPESRALLSTFVFRFIVRSNALLWVIGRELIAAVVNVSSVEPHRAVVYITARSATLVVPDVFVILIRLCCTPSNSVVFKSDTSVIQPPFESD